MNTEKLHNLALSENGFIFDPTSGYSYNTNQTGYYILSLLKQGLKKEEIVEKIANEYEVSVDNFYRDFDFFILQLKSLGLVGEY